MSGKAWYGRVGSNIWYFFNSLKLTLGVLITLAVVSIFGTIVEQNKPVSDYVQAYGEKWTNFIIALRLHDLFHSWWFIALLGALALNIIVCTFERFPPKWKSLLDHKPEGFDAKLIERFSNHQAFSLDAGAKAVKERVIKAFRKKRFDIIDVPSGNGEHHLYAWKGRLGRLGSDVTHISLLLILLGAIVGSFAGYKDFTAIYVGAEIAVPQETFKLRLDKFWIDYYDTGQIRQYNSLLTVVEDGKDVFTKQIWVNEPLYYKGVRFYQSSYGTGWNKLAEAQLQVKRKNGAEPEAPFMLKWKTDKPLPVPGTKYSARLVGYTADFAYDESTNTVFSKSADAENPAVNLEVYDGDRLVSTPWIFLNYPGIFPAIPGSDV
ncbi:MAG: cytochrome c biogenesis protein ResB, partial [Deltaproteobacteria bacterium]|nr:cytochrome c biogenesis protein ResB [Deltaproteobacteria bacterium]